IFVGSSRAPPFAASAAPVIIVSVITLVQRSFMFIVISSCLVASSADCMPPCASPTVRSRNGAPGLTEAKDRPEETSFKSSIGFSHLHRFEPRRHDAAVDEIRQCVRENASSFTKAGRTRRHYLHIVADLPQRAGLISSTHQSSGDMIRLDDPDAP